MNGQTQLKRWLTRSHLNQREGARILGVHFAYLNHLLMGYRTPGLATAIRIERLTGVSVESWLSSRVSVVAKRANENHGMGRLLSGKQAHA